MDRLGELAGRLVDGVCCWRPRGLTFVPVAKSFTQVFQYPKGLGYAMDNAASLRAEAIPLWGGVPFEVSSGGETARGYEPRG